MKKGQLLDITHFLGGALPAGKIQDRETRLAVVRTYASLAGAAKAVDDEAEALRRKLTEGHEEEIQRWAELTRKASDNELPEEERDAAKTEAAGLTDAVRINAEFSEALRGLLDEEATAEGIKKIDLALLFDALTDCGVLRDGAPIEAIRVQFAPIISESE